jgi:uroporphyrin-III C-methyltransferase/precorrin-2 dehydrogenase/sirohydrochlorin ferrochelatase
VAVVADGAMPTQRTVRTTLDRLGATMADEGIRPPAVWVVGEVVSLNGPHDAAAPDDADLD